MPVDMTDAIHRDWKQHVAKTTNRVVSEDKSFAFYCCLAGSNPTPVASMASVGEQNHAYWHQVMWSAVLSEEFQAGCGDEEFERAVRPVYANVNPQTALGASNDRMRLPSLSKLASISNAGSARSSRTQAQATFATSFWCQIPTQSSSLERIRVWKSRAI